MIRTRSGQLMAGGVVLGVAVGALCLLPLQVFWHPDEGAKFLAMLSLRWDHGITYDVQYRGRSIDPHLRFYTGRCGYGAIYPAPDADGGARTHWPFIFPLLSRPLFDRFGFPGLYVLPLLAGWLTAMVAGRWAADHDARLGGVATLVVGCSTPIVFYSVSFSEHTLATLCGAIAVSLLLGRGCQDGRRLWLVGVCLAIASVLRFEMFGLAAAVLTTLAVDAVARRRQSAPADGDVATRPGRPWSGIMRSLLVAIAVGAAVVSLLAPRHLEEFATVPNLVRRIGPKLPFVMESVVKIFMGEPGFDTALADQCWLLAMAIALVAATVAPFAATRRGEAVLIVSALAALLGSSVRATLWQEAYLARQGVLAVAPYMVVSTYVLVESWTGRDWRLFRLACVATSYAAIGCAAVFTSKVNDAGQYLIGLDGPARYLLMLYPMGSTLSVIAAARYWASDRHMLVKSAFIALVAGMLVVATAYEYRGLQMVSANRRTLVRWETALRRQDRVITNVWWLAGTLAPFSAAHEFYCVDQLSAVSDWAGLAVAHGITSFSFASVNPVEAEQFGPRAGQMVLGERQIVDGLYLARYHLSLEAGGS